MKIIFLLCTILFFSIVPVIAYGDKDPSAKYECSNGISKITNQESTITMYMSSTGKIHTIGGGISLQKLAEQLYKAKKCRIVPTKHYECTYPKGSCYVTISKEDGYTFRSAKCEVGIVENLTEVKERAEKGKCKLIKEFK